MAQNNLTPQFKSTAKCCKTQDSLIFVFISYYIKTDVSVPG